MSVDAKVGMEAQLDAQLGVQPDESLGARLGESLGARLGVRSNARLGESLGASLGVGAERARANGKDPNSYFKMGATVAVSELFGLGRLGTGAEAVGETRDFLASFGVKGMDDVAALGICGPYVEDLERIYA